MFFALTKMKKVMQVYIFFTWLLLKPLEKATTAVFSEISRPISGESILHSINGKDVTDY